VSRGGADTVNSVNSPRRPTRSLGAAVPSYAALVRAFGARLIGGSDVIPLSPRPSNHLDRRRFAARRRNSSRAPPTIAGRAEQAHDGHECSP
jgi:hypothetical protein